MGLHNFCTLNQHIYKKIPLHFQYDQYDLKKMQTFLNLIFFNFLVCTNNLHKFVHLWVGVQNSGDLKISVLLVLLKILFFYQNRSIYISK